jgi:hypothetical protein
MMPNPPEFDAAAAHKYFAARCFNDAWPLMDKAERSPDEALQLVALGHASLWHWTQRADCTDTNLSIGHWLLSRIYSVLHDIAHAQQYAESCLRISQRPGIEPFYLAYAYEAIARSASLAGRWAEAAAALDQARALAGRIDEADNRQSLLNDLATIRISKQV